jgi:FtsP/CotA-like multicopper oxidase with cupredoxin domain
MVKQTSPTRRSILAAGLCASVFPVSAQAQNRPDLILRAGLLSLPPIKAKRGEMFRLRVRNERREATALHWRGMRLPNAMDGAAPLTQKPIANGETFEIAFTPPDAGSFLCHANWRETSGKQMADGLIFPFIVEDEKDPPVDLDLFCLLQDNIKAERSAPHISINGAEQGPAHDLRPSSRVRLRLASASTQRMMSVALEGAKCVVAAIDGQPCGLFEPEKQTLPLAPAQRYDLFFDLPREAGQKVSLQLRALAEDTKAARALATFHTMGDAFPAHPPFAGLPANPLLPEQIPLQRATRRDLVLELAPQGGWLINGAPADTFAPAPLFSVKKGTPVVLGFLNKTGRPQLIHPHGHVMRHIHLFDDGWDPYWRDTILVPDRRTMRVAFVADNPGRWAISSGLDGRDGPVTWFDVS